MPNPNQPSSMRSGEWGIVQDAIQAAVSAAMNQGNVGYPQCREELEGIRGELRTEFGSIRTEMRTEFASMRTELNRGDTQFKLMNQRLDWMQEEREKELQQRREAIEQEREDRRERDRLDREAHKKSGDTSGFRKTIALKDLPPDTGRTDKKDRLLISPKLLNAVLLALAAGFGASLWGIISNAFAAPVAKVEAKLVPHAEQPPANTH